MLFLSEPRFLSLVTATFSIIGMSMERDHLRVALSEVALS
jgi:hypothetical protein